MSQFYSDSSRAPDPFAIPDCEAFQLTAVEVAATMEDEIYEFSKRREFRLYAMNRRVQETMLDAMVEELGITGGWFYQYCFPGCLPDSEPIGPYATRQEAIAAAQEEAEE